MRNAPRTHIFTGRVRVWPAGEILRPRPHPLGRIPVGYSRPWIKLPTLSETPGTRPHLKSRSRGWRRQAKVRLHPDPYWSRCCHHHHRYYCRRPCCGRGYRGCCCSSYRTASPFFIIYTSRSNGQIWKFSHYVESFPTYLNVIYSCQLYCYAGIRIFKDIANSKVIFFFAF
jgi:hypothetical protein